MKPRRTLPGIWRWKTSLVKSLLPSILLSSFILYTTAATAQTSNQLRVKRMPQGFSVSKEIDGQDVLMAYSDEGTYANALRVPAFRKAIAQFEEQDKLKMPVLVKSGLPDEVQPLCTDLWEQAQPFYALTPMIDSTHCYVGCVALNMAQAMYFYKYPAQGTGSHTYTDSLGCGQTLSADFSSHKYEWNYMIDKYKGVEYSDRQVNAVSQLLSDCGIAVDMKYGINASAASIFRQPKALVDYFGYDKAIRVIYRDFFSHSELHNLIRSELAANHPVLCSGYGIDGGGHAFIIDGYDSNGLYHINWGWGGWCNGYYNIDYMTPNQPKYGKLPDRQENGANILQAFTLGVQPQTMAVGTRESHEMAFAGISIVGKTTEKADCESMSELETSYGHDQTIVVSNLCNIGWNDFTGRVSLALKEVEKESPVAFVHEFNHDFTVEIDTANTDTLNLVLPSNLADGTYQLLPMYEDEDGWTEVRTSRGTPNYLMVKVDGENVCCQVPKSAAANLVLTDFQFPDTVTRGGTAEFSLTVSNESEDEFCGRFYVVYENAEKASGLSVLAGIGQYLQAGEQHTVGFRFAKMNIKGDEACIRVVCEPDLFTDSLIVFDQSKTVTVRDATTGIDEIVAEVNGSQAGHNESSVLNKETPLYNLSGRRIKSIPTKQIFITEGKKKITH